MYLKEFEIRWSDVDANRHLANAAYLNFMSHTRMAFLMELGFTHKTMETHGIGPVVFYEHMYYFKEAFLGKPIKVSMEVVGMSEDGAFNGTDKPRNFRILTKADTRKFAKLPTDLK